MTQAERKPVSPSLLIAFLAALAAAGCRQAAPRTISLEAPGLAVEIDGTGAVSGVRFTGPDLVRPVRAFPRLRDCRPAGRSSRRRTDPGQGSRGNGCLRRRAKPAS